MKVSVVGLGSVGSALAGALARGGHDVAVWNRTAGKTDALVGEGASTPATIEEAIAHGDVVLFALTNYDAVTAAFEQPLATGAFRGRVAVNLSTGSAGDARAAEEAFRAGGAAYIDGVVGCFPSALGTADAVLRYSGDAAAFERAQPALLALGENTRHAGPDVGTGNALQLAVFGFCTIALTAYFESAAFASSQGVEPAVYADLSLGILGALSAEISASIPRLEQHEHAGDQASIDIYVSQMTSNVKEAVAAGTGTGLLDASLRYLQGAVDAGRGGEEISAGYELARG